jgi:hypothetical protein
LLFAERCSFFDDRLVESISEKLEILAFIAGERSAFRTAQGVGVSIAAKQIEDRRSIGIV